MLDIIDLDKGLLTHYVQAETERIHEALQSDYLVAITEKATYQARYHPNIAGCEDFSILACLGFQQSASLFLRDFAETIKYMVHYAPLHKWGLPFRQW